MRFKKGPAAIGYYSDTAWTSREPLHKKARIQCGLPVRDQIRGPLPRLEQCECAECPRV